MQRKIDVGRSRDKQNTIAPYGGRGDTEIVRRSMLEHIEILRTKVVQMNRD